MSRTQSDKYIVPVQITKNQKYKWLNVATYEYKLYADSYEEKFTKIKFVDINGFIIGEHMPTKLQNLYDKTAKQVRTTTAKAVTELKNVVEDVADIAVGTASDIKEDLSKTVKQTAGLAFGLFDKLKGFNKNPVEPKSDENKTNPQTTSND